LRLLQIKKKTSIILAKKKPFMLRLDPELLSAVEKWAADEFRSTNGQLEWLISKALKQEKRYPKKKNNDHPETT
jgi:hypothetical protein